MVFTDKQPFSCVFVVINFERSASRIEFISFKLRVGPSFTSESQNSAVFFFLGL